MQLDRIRYRLRRSNRSMIIAILRTLRGPVFFPLRAFAAAYTDGYRGLPLLLVIFLLGFGCRRCGCRTAERRRDPGRRGAGAGLSV